MRILIVTPYFYPHQGGSQKYAEELHYHLMQADPTVKVDVLCYNTDGAKEVETYRGFTVYRIPCWEPLRGQFAIPNYFALWKLLKKLFAENRYDFINSHTRFFESSWWTPYVAHHFKTKSVLTDHCAFHPVHRSKMVSSIAHLADRIVAPFISRIYSQITVTNSATKKFVQNLGMKDPSIIYGGVDTDYFKPGINKTTHQNILITFVGRMIPSKGPDIFFEALQKIIAKYSNATTFFAGGGPLYEKLRAKANNQIKFLGSQQPSQLKKLLAKTHIFVHPSKHHEGFPNAILEAGAAGCAVIATDKGGTREIIINGKTGLIVEPTVSAVEKALMRLIENKEERIAYGKNLREHVVQNFSWNKIVVDYQRFIQTKLFPEG